MSQQEHPTRHVEYPSLRSILHMSGDDLGSFANALERVALFAFGTHHLLPATARRDRLTLHKLVNLIRQLQLMDDLPLYELSFRCPQQLRSYHGSLCRSLPRAQHNGLPQEQLLLAEKAHDHLWRVHNVVTSLYDGLS